MQQSYSIQFGCHPKYEKELIDEICSVIDAFRERNQYGGNNSVLIKICDPSKDDLIERLTQEAKNHAQEARTMKSIVHEIYKAFGFQKGDWNGVKPVIDAIRERDDLLTAHEHEQCGCCNHLHRS